MKQGRRIILIILSILLLSISYNLATAPTLHAQIYPMFPFFHAPWSSGLPLPPAPITLSAAPCIPFCTFPSALSLARSASVVTTTVAPVAVTAPVATILPPATTPAGYTVTTLIPVLAPAPLLPITTTTYGALTTLVLSGTSAYTLLSLILL
jgi:hypothetical protein